MQPKPLKPVTGRTSQTGEREGDRSTSQTARATLALREMLVQGKFLPGERLREMPLAKELGLSRIPLRLALERLAHEGFLEMRATRGFVVQQFSIADINDAIDLRGTLEGFAARLAAERLEDPRELETLEQLQKEMQALVRQRNWTVPNVAQYIDCNSRFHNEVMALSKNRRLQRAMDQVCSLPFASPSAFVRRHYVAPDSQDLFVISAEHHRSLLDAIRRREGARAESLAREHARLARRNLENAAEHQALGETVPALKLIKF